MNWIERANTDLTILCGAELTEDNNGTLSIGAGNPKVFKPNWLNAVKDIDYNISEFVFSRTFGSLVKRGQPRGTQYRMEIAFQGLDHLDVAKSFEEAARYVSPNTGFAPPWKITHPYYGVLYVQPVSLSIDNNTYNTSMIRAVVIETIKDNGRAFAPGADPVSTITAKAVAVNAGYARVYAESVPEPQVSDIQRMRNNVNEAFAEVSSVMNGYQQDVNAYVAKYNEINGLLNNTLFNVQQLADQIQFMLTMPAYFLDTLANRMRMFVAQAILLNRSITGIATVPLRTARSLKRLYETNMAGVIAGMTLATINNIGNAYAYRPDVLKYVSTITNTYNDYLTNLYLMQSLNGGVLYGWLPDAGNIAQLNILVNQAVTNLFNVANSAKQQRTKVLIYDSTLILLANELYGMKPDDSTVLALKTQNNFGLNGRNRIPAGTQVIYYV